VLLKPSPQTPLSGERFVSTLHAAGFPRDLVQVHHLSPALTARAVQHPLVSFVSFTGSVAGGRAVERAAAAADGPFKGVALELGGKDPAYVRPDADLPHAVAQLVDGAFYNSGQSCCAVERIYVHEDVYDAFVPAYVEEVKKYLLGDPAHEHTTLGPVVSVAAATKIRAQVEDAIKAGATAHVPPELFPAAKECVPCVGREEEGLTCGTGARRSSRRRSSRASRTVRAPSVLQAAHALTHARRDGADARRDVRPRRRHPARRVRRRGARADERQRVRAHRVHLHRLARALPRDGGRRRGGHGVPEPVRRAGPRAGVDGGEGEWAGGELEQVRYVRRVCDLCGQVLIGRRVRPAHTGEERAYEDRDVVGDRGERPVCYVKHERRLLQMYTPHGPSTPLGIKRPTVDFICADANPMLDPTRARRAAVQKLQEPRAKRAAYPGMAGRANCWLKMYSTVPFLCHEIFD
jgi:hypothetical protein